MSEAYQCDRCGVYGDDPQSTVRQDWCGDKYTMDGTTGDVQVDLCRDCTAKLRDWFHKPREVQADG